MRIVFPRRHAIDADDGITLAATRHPSFLPPSGLVAGQSPHDAGGSGEVYIVGHAMKALESYCGMMKEMGVRAMGFVWQCTPASL